MSYKDVQKNIEQYFLANLVSLDSDQIDYDNVGFDPTPGTPWIRLKIECAVAAKFISTGGASVLKRNSGFVMVQVFTEEGKGTSQSNSMCDEILNILEAGSLPTGETFESGYKVDVGNDNAGWYQTNVVIPFYYDEQRSL